VVAGAIGYGLDQVALPERLEALTAAGLSLCAASPNSGLHGLTKAALI